MYLAPTLSQDLRQSIRLSRLDTIASLQLLVTLLYPSMEDLQSLYCKINLSCLKGQKPGQAKIAKAVSDSTGDYQLGYNVGQVADTHPFSVNDFIAVEDNGTSPTIDSNFLSAGTVGKKVTAATGTTISTDIDSSSASADYTYASGKQAIVKRCVKITAGGQALVVEEIQVVGG